jgi:hypothetical protein
VVPDHRVRRLQHLLSDLVELLDQVSTLELHRPVRRCKMWIENNVVSSRNPLKLQTEKRISCDCSKLRCNPDQTDFKWRQLTFGKEGTTKEEDKVSMKPGDGNILMQKTTDSKGETPGSVSAHRIV